jgi:hypothetical protein
MALCKRRHGERSEAIQPLGNAHFRSFDHGKMGGFASLAMTLAGVSHKI